MNNAHRKDPFHIELRAQQRARQKKGVQLAIRKPTDPINVARLELWHERLREQGIKRHQMEVRP